MAQNDLLFVPYDAVPVQCGACLKEVVMTPAYLSPQAPLVPVTVSTIVEGDDGYRRGERHFHSEIARREQRIKDLRLARYKKPSNDPESGSQN